MSFPPSLLRYRPRKRITLETLFGALTIVAIISYKTGFYRGAGHSLNISHESSHLKNALSQMQKDKDDLRQKIMLLEHKDQIQLEAKKILGNHIKVLQEQNVELTSDMALYQTIAGAPLASGLQIKAFQIYNTTQVQTFRYLIVLSKQSAPQKYAKGAVMMTILGRIGDKAIQLPVKYVDLERDDGLAFNFRHFQELTGELTFPKNFIPDEVLLQVNPDSEWPPLAQQFPWTVESISVGG